MDRGKSSSFSRRALLRRTTAAGVTAATLLAVPANLMAAQNLLDDGKPSAGAAIDADNQDAGRDPVPDADAAKALLAAFDRVPVVALGEAHGLQEEHDFLAALLRDPAFPTTVSDIVVEFGNARYQDVVDRYLAGKDVAPGELRQAWRNTTQSPQQQWDSPIYEQFFRTVRDVNRSLPEAQRLRVHLGDPPVDWGKIRGRDDLMPFLLERDPHLAGVVEAVLAEGRNALVIAGAIHLLRGSPGSGQGRGTVVELIEERRPGSTFVAVPHLGFGDLTCELVGRPLPIDG
jgi:hypothetical protein